MLKYHVKTERKRPAVLVKMWFVPRRGTGTMMPLVSYDCLFDEPKQNRLLLKQQSVF